MMMMIWTFINKVIIAEPGKGWSLTVVLTRSNIWHTLEQQWKLIIPCIYSYYLPLWLRNKQPVDFDRLWCLSPYINHTKMTSRCLSACLLVFCKKGLVSNEVFFNRDIITLHSVARESGHIVMVKENSVKNASWRGGKKIDKLLVKKVWLIVHEIR